MERRGVQAKIKNGRRNKEAIKMWEKMEKCC